MAIVTVSTSNTFNEWRVVTNQLVTEVNKTESGTAVLVANTITANTITANSDVTVSGNTSITGTLGVTGNVTLAGELRGPSTFTIDPAAVGDNTGTVVIKGNLQVDGSTTTINSTTLTIDDKNIVVASGAADNAAADGAGLVVDGSNASITYLSTGDKFNVNKALELNSTLSVAGNTNFDTGTLFIDTANDRVGIGTTNPAGKLSSVVTTAGDSSLTLERTSSSRFEFQQGLVGVTGDALRILDTTLSRDYLMLRDGYVGIGTTAPASRLDVLNSGVAIATIRSSSTSGSREAKLRLNVPSTGGDDPAGMIEFTYGTDYTVAGSIQMTHTNPTMKFSLGGAEKVRITSAGHVGIGTTSPRYNTSGVTAGETTLTIFNSAQNGGGIELASATTTNTAAIGRLSWINTNNTDGTRAVAWIDTLVSGTTSGAQGGNMRFGTKEDNTAHSIKMVITGAGNVGINQAAPSQKLSVVGTANSAYTSASGIVLDYQSSTVNVTYPIGFAWSSSIGTQSSYWGMGLIPVTFASGTAHLGFYTQGVERMRISGGSLGVGTTSPTARLHIVDSGTANTSITEVQRLFYTSTETPAVGYGAGIGLYTANADLPSGAQTRVVIAGVAESVTASSEKTALVVTTPSSAGSGSQTERFRITSDGRVGIGATSPSNMLTVQSDGTGASFADDGAGQLVIRGSSNTSKRLGLGIDTTNNRGVIQAQLYGTGTYPLALNPAGGSVMIGTTTEAGALTVSGKIRTLTGDIELDSGQVTTNSDANSLRLGVNGNEKVRITSAGYLSIGNTNPGQVLSIASATDGKGLGFGGATNNYANIFGSYSSGDMMIATGLQGNTTVEGVTSSFGDGSMYRSAIRLSAFGGRGIEFFTNNTSTVARGTAITPNARMKIATDGKVGIGTTDPNSILHVSTSVDNGPGSATRISTGFGAGRVVIHNQDNVSTGNKMGLVFAHASDPGVAAVIGSYKESGNWRTGLQFYTNAQTGGDVDGITERMRLTADGKVGIGTTNPSYTLHVPGTSSLEAARYIYIPHTGVTGGYGNTAISNIHVGSYLDLQHFSYTNAPAFLFNARIKRSDFVGSGSGTASNYNIIEPYFSGGNYALISTVNGGISFNIGSWGGNSEIDLGDISNHSSYKGGHDGNSFVIRSTGANGLNMRPDAGDSNDSARAFFVNSSQTWAIMNNSGNLSFRSGATVGSDSGTQKVYFDTSGNVTISGVLTENSSIALKENVNPISNALDYISQLVGVTYDRKDGSAKNRAGLIKEEVEKVLPNVVNDNGIQYTNIIAYLVESIKDLKKEIDDLKKK